MTFYNQDDHIFDEEDNNKRNDKKDYEIFLPTETLINEDHSHSLVIKIQNYYEPKVYYPNRKPNRIRVTGDLSHILDKYEIPVLGANGHFRFDISNFGSSILVGSNIKVMIISSDAFGNVKIEKKHIKAVFPSYRIGVTLRMDSNGITWGVGDGKLIHQNVWKFMDYALNNDKERMMELININSIYDLPEPWTISEKIKIHFNRLKRSLF